MSFWEVMWAMATPRAPATQTDIIYDTRTGSIDPRGAPKKRETRNLTSRCIMTCAVRPFHRKDEFPAVTMGGRDDAEEVHNKWKANYRS